MIPIRLDADHLIRWDGDAGEPSAQPGSLWTRGNHLHYVDVQGIERQLLGVGRVLQVIRESAEPMADANPGAVWFTGTRLRLIGEDRHVYLLPEGACAD